MKGGIKKIRPLINDLVAVHGFRLAPTSLNPLPPEIQSGAVFKNALQRYCSHGDRHLGMGACFHGNFFAIFLMVSFAKHVLQIEVEVFHAVAATAENGEDGSYYLAVLIAYQLTAKS